jgi:hypothetical protein
MELMRKVMETALAVLEQSCELHELNKHYKSALEKLTVAGTVAGFPGGRARMNKHYKSALEKSTQEIYDLGHKAGLRF